MVKKTNLVEVNGKRYDTQSGRLVPKKAATSAKHAKPPVKYLDGVLKSKSSLPLILKPIKKQGKAQKTTGKSPSLTAQKVHSKRSKSKTLNRTALSKPERKYHVEKSNKKVTAFVAKPVSVAKISLLHTPSASPERLARAAKISLNKHVSRFGGNLSSKPVSKMPEFPNVSVKPAPQSRQPLHVTPSMITSTRHGELQNLLKSTLDKADSHTNKKVAKKNRRFRGLAVPTMAAMALVFAFGFFAYQNVPGAAIRLASTRSGVKASLPTYKPNGFSFSGPIKFNKQEVRVSYSSNGDKNRNYIISQSPTNWDDQQVVNEFLKPNRYNYQLVKDNGQSVYIYEGKYATWVDNGIWYRVEGNAELTSSQLLALAYSF